MTALVFIIMPITALIYTILGKPLPKWIDD